MKRSVNAKRKVSLNSKGKRRPRCCGRRMIITNGGSINRGTAPMKSEYWCVVCQKTRPAGHDSQAGFWSGSLMAYQDSTS